MKVTVWSWARLRRASARTPSSCSGRSGYRASTEDARRRRATSRSSATRARKAQIGTTEWISDYPAASGFFNALLTCASFLPEQPGQPERRRVLRPADSTGRSSRRSTEQATNPDAARGLWERVDRQIVDQAPWVPLVNPKSVDVLSKRVGNYQYSPPARACCSTNSGCSDRTRRVLPARAVGGLHLLHQAGGKRSDGRAEVSRSYVGREQAAVVHEEVGRPAGVLIAVVVHDPGEAGAARVTSVNERTTPG